MKQTLENIVTFVKVTPMQQMIAGLVTPFIGWCAYSAVENYSKGNIGLGTMNTVIGLVNLGSVALNEALGVHNLKQYHAVKKALEEQGWDERIIERKSHSWCQRNLTLVASYDAGYGKETKKYLKDKGYRWHTFLKN